MSNLTVENVYTRQTAKQLTKKHFWKLLGMMLTIVVITYAVVIATMGAAALLSGSSSGTVATQTLSGEATFGDVAAEVNPLAGIILLCAFLAVLLLLPGLSLGLTAATLDICRGEEHVGVGRVFCRMKHCLKAMGLSLWVCLKILLWALPVYAIIGFVGFGIAVSADPAAGQLNTESMTVLLMLLPLVALIAVCALIVPACLRYMLSAYVLADEPATGIRACVSQSKQMMKGHKWQAFKLTIPLMLTMYGIDLGVTLVASLAATMLGNPEAAAAATGIVVPLVTIVLSLYFSIRMTVCQGLFYLQRRAEQTAASESAE